MIVHGGLIAILQPQGWRGVLIRGPSGVGKSDLALRALDQRFRLVADDRVLLFASGGRVFGRSPEPLQGLMEIRGLGVAPVDSLRLCEVLLVVNCVNTTALERMPDLDSLPILGVAIPNMAICPLEPSAPAKLCRAIEVLGRVTQQAYDAAFPRTTPGGPT
jgi:serine kinase of HPr protein (carbohydrate metabolism regulator)